MTFTTFTFFVFLFLVLTLYWFLPRRRVQNLLLLLSSYVFYGWWDYRFCALMLLSSLVDYGVGRGLERTESPRGRKMLLGLSLLANLGSLGFFKYFNFFADGLIRIGEQIGLQVNPLTLNIILPVGISFYTFQTLSYTIDIYRKKLEARRGVIDYLAFVSFFPQLVAGPIERASQLLPQFEKSRRIDGGLASDGCRQILWGLAKKMLIADNLASLVDQCYRDPTAFSASTLALATVCFAFQIYCDFSGYSDIAIGTAKLFGMRLMRNFAFPYFSKSLPEFWRRWHVSLSSWFRDYVYIPLGGSRCTKLRQVRNVLITFTVSGFWHGASLNFIIWGFIHGVGFLPSILRTSKREKPETSDVPGGLSFFPSFNFIWASAFTFLIVCLGWVFFRAQTLQDAGTIIMSLVSVNSWLQGWGETWRLIWEWKSVFALLACLLTVEWCTRHKTHPFESIRLTRPLRWMIYTVIIWLILKYTYSQGPFIYFQF